MPKRRVFVDTNAIFPAVQAGEWKRLCGHFSIETVAAVVKETQNGDINRKGYVPVDRAMLEQSLAKIHHPTEADDAAFKLKAHELNLQLDEGERDLLAYLLANETPSSDILVLTTSDRAAVRASCELGWKDALISLERLLTEAGAQPAALKSLAEHHREQWLSQVRTSFLLGLFK